MITVSLDASLLNVACMSKGSLGHVWKYVLSFTWYLIFRSMMFFSLGFWCVQKGWTFTYSICSSYQCVCTL